MSDIEQFTTNYDTMDIQDKYHRYNEEHTFNGEKSSHKRQRSGSRSDSPRRPRVDEGGGGGGGGGDNGGSGRGARRSRSRERKSRERKDSHRAIREYSRSRSRSISRGRKSYRNSRYGHRTSRSRSPYRGGRYTRSRSRSFNSRDRERDRHRRSRSGMSSRRRHIGHRDNPQPSRCLGVFGLSTYTTEQQICNIFSKYGPLSKVTIVIDAKTKCAKGFSFVYFQSMEDAKVAREQCTGMEIDGRKIRVDFSITERAHTPTPGVYMGKPTHVKERRYEGSRYRELDHRRSPTPYYKRRSRYRSRSYSPRRY